MGSVMDCKRNPCCGDRLSCTYPPEIRPGETWEEYEQRARKEKRKKSHGQR